MMRAIAMAMRVASDNEGKGGKAMATVTRVACKQGQQQQSLDRLPLGVIKRTNKPVVGNSF
jgi:hypothetical protein